VQGRVLAWEGCLNVRDLGGLPTEDGVETRFGRVVRSDSPALLSETGWRALVDYGVTTIVDLRRPAEREDDPPRTAAIDVTHVSLLGADDEPRWTRLEALAAAAPSQAASTAVIYRDVLAVNGAELAQAVGAVAGARSGAVLVHCVGGKDRTALVTALLLRLAGVPTAAIAADYALSEVYLAPRHEEWLAAARDETERRRLERIAATPAGAMQKVLDEVDDEHGGAEAYLHAHGLGDDVIARARARLLDGP
jgi:protein tyrosine/serine phosphatase